MIYLTVFNKGNDVVTVFNKGNDLVTIFNKGNDIVTAFNKGNDVGAVFNKGNGIVTVFNKGNSTEFYCEELRDNSWWHLSCLSEPLAIGMPLRTPTTQLNDANIK